MVHISANLSISIEFRFVFLLSHKITVSLSSSSGLCVAALVMMYKLYIHGGHMASWGDMDICYGTNLPISVAEGPQGLVFFWTRKNCHRRLSLSQFVVLMSTILQTVKSTPSSPWRHLISNSNSNLEESTTPHSGRSS